MSNILHNSAVFEDVAGNVRRLRRKAGLSQEDLASAAGVSRRMLVSVESGSNNVSLGTLARISSALRVAFAELVFPVSTKPATSARVTLWRGRDSGSYGALLETSPVNEMVEVWEWVLEPGERYVAEPDPPGYGEIIFVIDGVLTLELDGERKSFLPGETIKYRSDQHYAYFNNGESKVRFIRNVFT